MKTILIIEDEVLIAQSLKKLLQRAGHRVDTTESGQEAIRLLQSQAYDRVVCDLMLQDISGFDVLEESRRQLSPDEFRQKFIIMTAYNSPQVLEKARDYQCLILNKPFDDLRSAISKITGEAP